MTVHNRALHFLDHPEPEPLNQSYVLKIPIPKHVFNKDYPANLKFFGDRLSKACMDAGIQIEELVVLIEVIPDTIINWELRGIKDRKKNIRNKRIQFIENGSWGNLISL